MKTPFFLCEHDLGRLFDRRLEEDYEDESEKDDEKGIS